MRKFYSLYGRLLCKQLLRRSFVEVRKSKGAAGIDGQSLKSFESRLEDELANLFYELKEKRYQPQPVRRVMIPKAGGGQRGLGIPTVRDRVVQQALRSILEPIFEPHFHPSSYGYRPKRSCHDAIDKASLFIRQYNRCWVVDMDLSKCFDTLNHEIILRTFQKRVADSSILKLLHAFLESGVMINHDFEQTQEGSPQGGVISPLIANVYLDQFDQEMKRRGHRIVRYADDILILCASQSAAVHAKQVATNLLEEDLKLKVNRQKTHLTHSDQGVKYLGVEIHRSYTGIQRGKIDLFKAKIKAITRRNAGLSLKELILRLNPILRGFANYFQIANCKGIFRAMSGWIRRRLRAIQLSQWKQSRRLHRRLKQLGYSPPFKHIKMRSWRNARSPLASFSMPNYWFHDELGLVDLDKIQVGSRCRKAIVFT